MPAKHVELSFFEHNVRDPAGKLTTRLLSRLRHLGLINYCLASVAVIPRPILYLLPRIHACHVLELQSHLVSGSETTLKNKKKKASRCQDWTDWTSPGLSLALSSEAARNDGLSVGQYRAGCGWIWGLGREKGL